MLSLTMDGETKEYVMLTELDVFLGVRGDGLRAKIHATLQSGPAAPETPAPTDPEAHPPGAHKKRPLLSVPPAVADSLD